MRGATFFGKMLSKKGEFQPTRPLRGATWRGMTRSARGIGFQPTRPLRGATTSSKKSVERLIFQPTRPLRGATAGAGPRTRARPYFNPRAPCGARRRCVFWRAAGMRAFQPTRPLRGATCGRREKRPVHGISTHAPLAGRDLAPTIKLPAFFDFNPRAPCGARL